MAHFGNPVYSTTTQAPGADPQKDSLREELDAMREMFAQMEGRLDTLEGGPHSTVAPLPPTSAVTATAPGRPADIFAMMTAWATLLREESRRQDAMIADLATKVAAVTTTADAASTSAAAAQTAAQQAAASAQIAATNATTASSNATSASTNANNAATQALSASNAANTVMNTVTKTQNSVHVLFGDLTGITNASSTTAIGTAIGNWVANLQNDPG